MLGDEVWWTYDGIDDPDRDTLRWLCRSGDRRDGPANKLAATLRGSERYMNDRFDEELKYQVEEDIYRDEWEEHCVEEAHKEGRCPHVPEQADQYAKELAARIDDRDAREAWYHQRLCDDWQWYSDRVNEECVEIEFVVWFLEKHPIDGAIRFFHGENCGKVDLEDIVGFCPSCSQPAQAEDIKPITPPYDTDEDGQPLHAVPTFECTCCGAVVPLNEKEIINTNARPFNWPPDAPYPPRRHFDGTPLDVPFYEE